MNTWRDAVPSRDAQLEMKRDAIYREAAAAFNRRGFHGTSMDDIAHALGVTKAALYRYVPNKHQLLYRCHLDAMDAAFASLEHGRAAGGSGLEMLERTLRGYLGAIIDEFGHRVVLLEENALEPAHAARIVARRDAFEAALRDLVELGIADGSIVACDPKLAVFALLGALNWVPKWYAPKGAWSGGQLPHALARLLVRAIAAHPGGLDGDVGAVVVTDSDTGG